MLPLISAKLKMQEGKADSKKLWDEYQHDIDLIKGVIGKLKDDRAHSTVKKALEYLLNFQYQVGAHYNQFK